MLTPKRKSLLGHLLHYAFVAVRNSREFDQAILANGYVEIRNEQEQSFRFDMTTVDRNKDNEEVYITNMVEDVTVLELNHKGCDFDLDPMAIGIDKTIVGELWVNEPLELEQVIFVMPLGFVNLPPLTIQLSVKVDEYQL